MARPLRIEYPGAWYHVMNRGRRGENVFLGEKDYEAFLVEWIKGKFYQQKQHAEVPESRQLAPTIADIKKAVCQLYKENEKILEQSKRGQVNEPRNLSIYLARRHSGLRLSEIGREFGLEKYSSVSSIVMRTEQLISQNKQLKKRLEKVRSMLRKSQAKT